MSRFQAQGSSSIILQEDFDERGVPINPAKYHEPSKEELSQTLTEEMVI